MEDLSRKFNRGIQKVFFFVQSFLDNEEKVYRELKQIHLQYVLFYNAFLTIYEQENSQSLRGSHL